MQGSAEGRRLLSAIVAKRESAGLARGDMAALILALRDHDSYLSRSCTHRTPRARATRSGALSAPGRYRARVCDFFQPFKIPLDGFNWLWKLIEERLAHEPELYAPTLAIF